MVTSENVKIYQAMSDGTVDKFFEMQRSDAMRTLDIYRRSGQQVERLSEFYEVCKSLDAKHGERFIRMEQPFSSFLQDMKEYVREAPRERAQTSKCWPLSTRRPQGRRRNVRHRLLRPN